MADSGTRMLRYLYHHRCELYRDGMEEVDASEAESVGNATAARRTAHLTYPSDFNFSISAASAGLR
jgi:hypothetical protein